MSSEAALDRLLQAVWLVQDEPDAEQLFLILSLVHTGIIDGHSDRLYQAISNELHEYDTRNLMQLINDRLPISCQ